MQTAEQGDRVLIRYTTRLEDGTPAFRRAGRLLELTAGVDPPRLAGLGLALVGLAPGGRVAVTVSPQQAYGPYNPARTYRLSRDRLGGRPGPVTGRWVRVADGRGRRRLVRVLCADDRAVLVDANHPLAGHTLKVEAELIAVRPSRPSGAPPCEGRSAPARPRAVAFDVDDESLVRLREALPGWEVEAVAGATADSLCRTWDPARADLLVVGLGERVADGLALCRFLAFCSPYSGDAWQAAGARQRGADGGPPATKADAALLVLIPPGREALVRAALAAGAHSCLTLPVHAKQVASMLAHARTGNQPGRHTLGNERAQRGDPWRDDGGEG